MLDPINDLHLYALHYVYLPRINRSIKSFSRGWNSHSLRTEHGHSPQQLFTTGLLLMQQSGLTAFDFFDTIDESEYGIDEEGMAPDSDDTARVTIPQLRLNLSAEHFSELEANFNPLSESSNHGIEIYQEVVLHLENVIRENPQYAL